MEGVFYNHANTEDALRRADLWQAMQAFLADASSRAALQLVGLFVCIPTPSTITATTSLTSSIASQIPATTSAAGPRRQRSAQKLAWCAWEAERRLKQASEDAAELNRYILHGALATEGPACVSNKKQRRRHCNSSPSSSRLTVVVVAYLAPQAPQDLTVYESWQRCAEACTAASAESLDTSASTRQRSPLRRATLIALALGAPSLLLAWSERATRCHLCSLLLPHQSLLLDLSWCVGTSLTAGAEVADAAPTSGVGRGRVSSQVLLNLFLQDVLPCLKFPKGESRTAFWLSYASLMAALHPRVFLTDEADLGLAARPAMHRQRTEDRGNVNAEAFAKTHRLIRQLFSALFHSTSPAAAAAPGRTQALRVVLGYGGAVAPLKRQLVHVVGQSHGKSAASVVDAALLRTRSLVDVYSLFGVLVGQDRVDFYAAASAFVRTMKRRSAAAAAAPVLSSGARHAVASTLVHVEVAASAPTRKDTPNPFVEVGARALSRRRAQLERRRLGKGKAHLRPRDRAARAQKHAVARKIRQTAALDSDEKKTDRKRGADPTGNGVPQHDGSVAATVGSSSRTPAKKRQKAEAAAVPTTEQKDTAGEGLSWSVDVG